MMYVLLEVRETTRVFTLQLPNSVSRAFGICAVSARSGRCIGLTDLDYHHVTELRVKAAASLTAYNDKNTRERRYSIVDPGRNQHEALGD